MKTKFETNTRDARETSMPPFLENSAKKTANNIFNSKGHNCNNKNAIRPKRILDLHITMMNRYTKFHFCMYNLCEYNERKLQNIGFSLKSKGHNSIKNIARTPNLTLPRKCCIQNSQYVQPLRRK